MKLLVRAFGIAAATVLIAGLCLGQRAQVATNQAVLAWMYGTVQVRHGTAGWTAATLNDVLKSGDAIKTGADSRGELSLGRDGYVRMDENSHLLLTHLQQGGLSSFKAIVGGVWVIVFFFKQKTAYEIMPSLVGSEMCIRDRYRLPLPRRR